MRESYNHPNVPALNVFDISPEVMTQIYQIIQYSPIICCSFRSTAFPVPNHLFKPALWNFCPPPDSERTFGHFPLHIIQTDYFL